MTTQMQAPKNEVDVARCVLAERVDKCSYDQREKNRRNPNRHPGDPRHRRSVSRG